MPSPFAAMILAAGFGSRLAPLTDEIPKPLLPVGDRPLLVSSLEQLAREGAQSLSVNVHHLRSKISNVIDGLGTTVHVFVEEKILGTAGGIRAASSSFRAPQVVVVNGDMFGPLPIQKLLEYSGAESVVMAVRTRRPSEGAVGLGADGRIVRLRGEVFDEEILGADYLGVARLSDRCWTRFPEQGCLVGDYLIPALRRGERVGAAPVEENLFDVGSLSGYVRANMDWLRKAGPKGGSLVGADVSGLGSVRLVDSILGAGVRVRGEGELRRVIALPGARVEAPLEDAVVTPSGRVVRVEREGIDH